MKEPVAEKMHEARGTAIFGCKDCGREVSVGWEAGYPPLEVPTCEHGPMKRLGGDDHTKLVPRPTEEELLEAEVRAELELEQAAAAREARKVQIRDRLVKEAAE